MKAYALNYQIKEIPTTWTDRDFGESNFPLMKSLICYFPWLKIILFKNELKKITNKFKEIQEIEVKNTDKKN